MATLVEEHSESDEGEQTEGSRLREMYEAEKAARQKLEGDLRTYKVAEILQSKGFDLVKPEELEGVELDQIEARAETLHSERSQFKESVLREFLAAQGVEGEDLEQMVSQYAAQRDQDSQEAEALSRARAAGSVSGAPVPRINPDKVHGRDAIAAALAAQTPKRR